MTRIAIRRALISVSDKSGLVELAQALVTHGVEIVSTGSTAATIAQAGIAVTQVSEVTGFQECLDGRVKTLHPSIHAGILADLRNNEHQQQLASLGIKPFELVVINLYPFKETVASGAGFAECVEQIDIGGPAMVRAAAKNHANVAIVVSPQRYGSVVEALSHGGFDDKERRSLAAAAFAHTAAYDVAVASWMQDGHWPEFAGLALQRAAVLRYGENPHQQAALYVESGTSNGLAHAKQLHGKEMSYNNYVDADAAWRAAHDHVQACVAIIKHTNPCGIAIDPFGDIAIAYERAHAGDPVSAFGGVIAANRTVTLAMAQGIAEVFTEVVVAPDFEPEALALLAQKPNIRLLTASPATTTRELRPISGGVLMQDIDGLTAPGDHSQAWTHVCGESLSTEELVQLEFAWRCARAVKSNAIVLAKDFAVVGVGMGQVNRVDSARLAVARAGQERAAWSFAASDAFFPFADGLEILIAAGVRAVVQPGGSVRDTEVIDAAQRAGISMYFTGTRHFSH